MRSRIWLILWLVGILFPMAFLGSLWPAFGGVFNAVFAPDWLHVVMHAFLYGVLGILLARRIRLTSIKPVIKLYGLVFLVACLHECLQVLTAGQWPGWSAELLDVGVDLAGTTFGLGLIGIYAVFRGKELLKWSKGNHLTEE